MVERDPDIKATWHNTFNNLPSMEDDISYLHKDDFYTH